jgi:CRP-like cAMP-binding protein
MAKSKVQEALDKNWILSSLPEDAQQRLIPHLEYVPLPRGKILYMPEDTLDYVFFPCKGVVSLISLTENGNSLEVGVTGSEGMVGIPAVLDMDHMPYQATVQVSGAAAKIRTHLVREEFNRGETLQPLLLRYTYVLIMQLSQAAVCNRFHTIEERLCRWLLMICDRVESKKLNLTQQELADLMGSHRPNVAVVASALQKVGLIHYSRGQVTILDTAGLESAACECYRVTKNLFSLHQAACTA